MASSSRVLVRVSAGNRLGMGHLVRCSHLARELLKHNEKIVFLVDQHLEQYTPWLSLFQVRALYGNDEFASQKEDAARCLEHIEDRDIVIVDDYRLDAIWETAIAQRASQVVVLDDLENRPHDCDILVDYSSSSDPSRYQNTIAARTKRLLGPDYCLLAETYRNRKPTPNVAPLPFTTTLSLGGGGNLADMKPLIETLLSLPPQQFQFNVVVGSLSSNNDYLATLAENNRHLKIIRNASNLSKIFSATHFFIGAAGTALYELNACNVPALTFSISENQQNRLSDLEQLGHYLHIPVCELQNIDAVKKLVITVKREYSRIKKLCMQRTIIIDGYGAQRVAHSIRMGELSKPEKTPTSEHTLSKENVLAELQPGITLSEVQDTEINRYLDARNLPANRNRMTVNQTLPRIEHYNWWFNNSRKSFALRSGGELQLFIWHQLKSDNIQPYLIGGWFIANENCSFELSALALQWQLQYCRDLHPEAIWLAIINKNNKYVNLLNSLYGFTPVTENSPEYRAIENYFPLATPDRFNYVACSPARISA